MSLANKINILVFSLILFYTRGVSQNQDSLISFRPNIDWALFKGVETDDTSSAAISTSLKLEVAKVSIWTGKARFKAYAVMNPKKSWVRINHASEVLLQHEQTHFDMTEFCARGLQQELNQMNLGLNKKALIEAVEAKWEQKLEQLQEQYDNQTRHGTNLIIQKEWSKRFSHS